MSGTSTPKVGTYSWPETAARDREKVMGAHQQLSGNISQCWRQCGKCVRVTSPEGRTKNRVDQRFVCGFHARFWEPRASAASFNSASSQKRDFLVRVGAVDEY